ncbi:MAG: hypothetical protein HC853_14315 [Anaerolineae bacterium]|nr:hypothetical protein [Anaerolineae bacterium]
MHTTNYSNTFIEVADDCKADRGTIPPEKPQRTIAQIQYDLIFKNPYKFTSDDVIFAAYAEKNKLAPAQLEEERLKYFSKGQACLRASPLGKTYGWGVHSDAQSRVAIYGKDSKEYKQYAADKSLKHLKAMKSAR